MADVRWMGGDLDENAARDALVHALGPSVGLTHTIDREEMDELRIEFPHGAFVVKAPRLWLSWQRAPDVTIEEREPRAPRPRWQTAAALVLVAWSIFLLPSIILKPHVWTVGSAATGLLLAATLWWGRE